MADMKQTNSAPRGRATVIRPRVTKLTRHESRSACEANGLASPFITVSDIRIETSVILRIQNVGKISQNIRHIA